MSFPHPFDALPVVNHIRVAFQLRHPALYKWLFEQGVIDLILFWNPDKDGLRTERAIAVIDELLRVLGRDEFRRSQARQRALTGVVVATALRRPQFGDTAGVRKLFEKSGGKIANVATEFSRIKLHLRTACEERGSRVRIRIPGSGDGRRTYTPVFDFANENGDFPEMPPDPSELSDELSSAACAIYIAAHLRHGDGPVVIYARSDAPLLRDEAFSAAVCDPARRCRVTVSLLHPELAGAEAEAVERTRDRLMDWTAPGLADLEVSYHRDQRFHMVIVEMAGGDLLIREDWSETFFHLKPADRGFASFRRQIPGDQSGRRARSDR